MKFLKSVEKWFLNVYIIFWTNFTSFLKKFLNFWTNFWIFEQFFEFLNNFWIFERIFEFLNKFLNIFLNFWTNFLNLWTNFLNFWTFLIFWTIFGIFEHFFYFWISYYCVTLSKNQNCANIFFKNSKISCFIKEFFELWVSKSFKIEKSVMFFKIIEFFLNDWKIILKKN